jgi:hypothetical protein
MIGLSIRGICPSVNHAQKLINTFSEIINKLVITITRCSVSSLLLHTLEVSYFALGYQLCVIYPQSLCALLLTESEDKSKAIPVQAWTDP